MTAALLTSISVKLVLELLRMKLSLAVNTVDVTIGFGLPLTLRPATVGPPFLSTVSKERSDLESILVATKFLKLLKRLTSRPPMMDFFLPPDMVEHRLTLG